MLASFMVHVHVEANGHYILKLLGKPNDIKVIWLSIQASLSFVVILQKMP